jgi:uncharacterized membrane protein YeaQ/YmgE (transglycosylase-associated protein family)
MLQKLLNKAGVTGALAVVVLLILGLLVVSPLVLLWGLNSLGFDVPYTFKTFLGAIAVILVLRSSGSSQK